jgi:hypothetical protein
MNKPTLTTHYANIVQAIKAMLQAQADYFQERKHGHPGERKLQISREKEAAARDLFKRLHNSRPVIIEAEITALAKEYNNFLDRCKVLLSEQVYYFRDTSNKRQLAKCKSLEKHMRELIKKYEQRTPQMTLL